MEDTIIQSLLLNDTFFNKAFSNLNTELFQTPENHIIFDEISKYVDIHDRRPSLKEIGLSIKESNKIKNELKKSTLLHFKEIAKDTPIENIDFLLQKTQTWVQKQKLTKAIFTAADIIQADGEFEPIVGMVEEALEINFDDSVGLDYDNSIDERLEYYKSKEAYTPLGLKSIDKTLGGGIRPSSLFMFIGPTHSGKTAAKVFTGANLLLKKENVLFITLEMPELEIAKRFDANLLGYTINELSVIDNETGLICHKNTPEALAECIIALIRNKYKYQQLRKRAWNMLLSFTVGGKSPVGRLLN